MSKKIKKTNTFQVKFNNKNVHPENIRMSDLAEVLRSIEEGLLSIVHKETGPILNEGIGVSLLSIKKGCAALEFAPTGDESVPVIQPAMREYFHAIKSKDRSDRPREVRTSIRSIEEFSVKYRCNSEFRYNSSNKNPNAIIRPPKRIELVKELPISGETTLYGYVVTVGGATSPTVWLKQSDGTRFQIIVSIDQAKLFGKKIYSWVALRGFAEWDENDKTVQKFKLEEMIEYEQLPLTKAFEKLSEEIGHYFEEIQDIEGEVLDLRKD